MTNTDKLTEARKHLSKAFELIEGVEGLDGLEHYAATTLKGDVSHCVRRLSGLLVFVGRESEL